MSSEASLLPTDLKNIHQTVCRSRRKMIPKLHKSHADVQKVPPQVTAQNICAQLMSRVSELYRNSIEILRSIDGIFRAELMSNCAQLMNR